MCLLPLQEKQTSLLTSFFVLVTAISNKRSRSICSSAWMACFLPRLCQPTGPLALWSSCLVPDVEGLIATTPPDPNCALSSLAASGVTIIPCLLLPRCSPAYWPGNSCRNGPFTAQFSSLFTQSGLLGIGISLAAHSISLLLLQANFGISPPATVAASRWRQLQQAWCLGSQWDMQHAETHSVKSFSSFRPLASYRHFSGRRTSTTDQQFPARPNHTNSSCTSLFAFSVLTLEEVRRICEETLYTKKHY